LASSIRWSKITLKLDFHKYEATGNDFILLDQEINPLLVAKLCHRRYGIGADGLISLCNKRVIYYNQDGSRAPLCLNAVRCAITHIGGGVVDSDVGLFRGEKEGVYIKPAQYQKELFVCGLTGHFYHAGVPHFIIEGPFDLEKAKSIRFDPIFGKEGTNVNFYERVSENLWRCRTYERGVEAETFSCGTGASACFTHMKKKQGTIEFPENNALTFSILDEEIFMQGRARLVFSGAIQIAPVYL